MKIAVTGQPDTPLWTERYDKTQPRYVTGLTFSDSVRRAIRYALATRPGWRRARLTMDRNKETVELTLTTVPERREHDQKRRGSGDLGGAGYR